MSKMLNAHTHTHMRRFELYWRIRIGVSLSMTRPELTLASDILLPYIGLIPWGAAAWESIHRPSDQMLTGPEETSAPLLHAWKPKFRGPVNREENFSSRVSGPPEERGCPSPQWETEVSLGWEQVQDRLFQRFYLPPIWPNASSKINL